MCAHACAVVVCECVCVHMRVLWLCVHMHVCDGCGCMFCGLV